ncbi:band 4.1-like protein 2 isoform X3 [Denticeps clupeoides]|uniref:FERM domain-containing protein n=1 Tax=Denticeps clupeoides TaxID=299321 RepID=A0AAY4DYM1_9TELE|nr:band 4.1-like protein 2 isoform X3 [Denticeps clupeoides]
MTTEVGSETEVKKEPEKVEQQQPPAVPEQDSPTTNDTVAKKDPEPAATETTAADTNTADSQQSQDHADAKPETPCSDEATSKEKDKEREQSGGAGKGISRFLPPWLKKQKSQTQVGPKESAEKEVSVEAIKEGVQEEEDKNVGGQEAQSEESKAKNETLGKEVEQEPDQEVKTDSKEVDKHSLGSADTQPAKEEKVGETNEKEPEECEKKEEPVEQKKEEDHSTKLETSILSPLRLSKKIKMVVCQVTMLDGTVFPCEVEKRAKGQYLFFKVCENLNLMEKDYFGLTFKDAADQKCWLDPAKEIKRQIRSAPWHFVFSVKFYPPDPSQLTEDLTRYLLCLQLRQDIASGRLPCSFVTHTLLGSYALQAELGDHDPEEHRLDYISDFQFAPSQNKELEEKVVELHKSHRGMTPAQADANFLENAKKLSMYGVDLHHAKDSEGVDIMLGVCANGLLIYKDRLRINRFAWPKILKISYKRSNFYIKIRPGEAEQFESTVGFKLPNHRAAKKVWKVCVEHHTFFRLMTPEPPTKPKFLTLGSKFRYSGRTQAQTRQASILIDRPAPYFERTASKRISRSLDGAPVVSVTDMSGQTGEKENGLEPGLEMSSDSKSKLRVQGENIYVRHSNLMLEDLDKTQEDVLKHQASISELKRSFMEAKPEPRPSQWDKRLTASPVTSLRLQAQGSLEEELTSLFLSKASFSIDLAATCTASAGAAEGTVVSEPVAHHADEKALPRPESLLPESRDDSKNADEKLKSEPPIAATAAPPAAGGTQLEVEIEETVIIEEVRKAPKAAASEAMQVQEKPQEALSEEAKDEKKPTRDSTSSDSESEEEAEYHPQMSGISTEQIKEEPEKEDQEEAELSVQDSESQSEPTAKDEPAPPTAEDHPAAGMQDASEQGDEEILVTPDEAPNGHMEAPNTLGSVVEEEEEPKVNGDASHAETAHLPQVICCSEPPVVKTEMVTISDTFAAQKTEISTKEVPIVHTETKTITYEAAQLDGNTDGEPGVLMTAQTITSESLCTTTTTHITKTLKGGLSETRIEKRIVITGDSDIDHDQALAQAIKEAKEQHPDMSVTRVVVHKETELAEEED